MNNNSVFSLTSLLIVFSLFSCKKEVEPTNQLPSPLPINTSIGANTFIFRVNEGDVINSLVGYIPAMPRLHVFYNHDDPYFNGDHLFEITGRRELLGVNQDVSISIKTMTYEGKHTLSLENNFADYGNYTPINLHYWTDNSNKGELNITKLDTINHIISGVFKFKAQRHNNGETLNETVIIDGQFDVNYKPNIGVNYY